MDNNLSLAELKPAKEELQLLADKAKNIDITNLSQVHTVRIELRDTRNAITKKGKELREKTLAFNKAVIATEKELIAIITPEEDRLDAIETEAKLKIEMEARRAELPSRKDALSSIEDDVFVTDEELLAMDDDQFNAYRLTRIDEKLKKDRADFEAKKLADEAEARKKADEEFKAKQAELAKQEAEAAEKRKAEEAKLAEERKAIEDKQRADEAKLAAERAEVEKEKARIAGIEEERMRKDIEEKAMQKVKEETLAREKKEKEDREKQGKYQAWLKEIGFDERSDILKTDGGVTVAYRKLAEYKHD